MKRRTLLIGGAGLGFGLGMLGPTLLAEAGPGDRLRPGSTDWRRRLALSYSGTDAPMLVRPLQGDLELWDLDAGGYYVVDASTCAVVEMSADSDSPLRATAAEELVYLGLGSYLASDGGRFTDALNAESIDASTVHGFSRESGDLIRSSAEVDPGLRAAARSDRAGDPPNAGSGDIKSRITDYSYVTGSHVYPNTSGTCGWVAASMVLRYWHARYSSRNVVPSSYRTGTNLKSSKNFATYLQGDSSDSSWGKPVRDRLRWHGDRQKLKYGSSWAAGQIGAGGQLDDNRPVILLGKFPNYNTKKKPAHAVVAYGKLKSGGYVVHYGYQGRTSVKLNAGLVGSNTKFELK